MNWSRSRSQNKENQMEPEPKIGKLNGAGAENRKKVESEPTGSNTQSGNTDCPLSVIKIGDVEISNRSHNVLLQERIKKTLTHN